MTPEQIAERMTFNPCIRCGCQVPAADWRFVKAGILVARCQVEGCGCRQLAWLFDEGEPMFDDDDPPLEREIRAALGEAEPMTAAEAEARLVDGLEPDPPPNSPEDIGGPDSGWHDTEKQRQAEERAERARANLRLLEGAEPPMPPVKPPEVDATDQAIAEARAQKKAAVTQRERDAAERKLRKARKAEREKKQAGFAGLWGKDQPKR